MLTTEQIHDMTYSEITAHVFKGVPSHEAVSLTDRIGEDALFALLDHPAWDLFPNHFQDWVWADIDDRV